ncbi:MAG: hypothetical protein D6715_02855 [Calditrichaeota bacterium]|nr:MAG: hypothetical protein D6715_02855 [Calditrichota bacterium]
MKRIGRLSQVLFLAGGLLLAGCPSGSNQMREPAPSGEDREAAGRPVKIDQLLEAPTQLRLGNLTLHLEAYLWRDFQPVSPPSGQPLRVSVKIVARPQPEKPLSSWLKAQRVYLVYGPQHQTWEADLNPSGSAQIPPGVLEAFASGGPLWEPGGKVEVIVRLQDQEGHSYLLRAPQQVIQKTY